LTPQVLAFIEKVKADTAKASRILWETRTLSASQTEDPGRDTALSTPPG